MTNTATAPKLSDLVIADALARRDKMVAAEESWGCDWTDFDSWRAYVDAIKTVSVWAVGPREVVATIAATEAGRIHAGSILGAVLDSQVPNLPDTAWIQDTPDPLVNKITW